jgi:hypothetical protein
MIANRWPRCLDRFDAAFEAQRRLRAGTGSEYSAALEIRTAIEGVKGELFEEARHNIRENMDWDMMAGRLCRDVEHQQLLLNQEVVYKTLHGHLSTLAKRRPVDQIPSIDALWTMFLDHLLIMLT